MSKNLEPDSIGTHMTEQVAKKDRHLICMNSSCKKGEHTFIVTTFITSAGKQKATMMKCQCCLMPIEVNEASQNWVVNAKWLTENQAQ